MIHYIREQSGREIGAKDERGKQRHRNEQVQLQMTKGHTPGIDHRESRCGTKREERHFDGEDYTKQQGELFDKNFEQLQH